MDKGIKRLFHGWFMRSGKGRLLAAGVLMLVVLGSCQRSPHHSSIYPTDTHEGSAPIPPPRITLRWHMPARIVRSVQFSPDGEYIGVVDSDGNAVCYDSKGKFRWQVSIPGTRQLQVSSGGESAVAYTLLNPVRREIFFIQKDGKISWSPTLDGTPWAVAVKSSENKYVVGTGDGYIYVYTIEGKRKRYSRWKIDGAPTSIAYEQSDDDMLIGTWQDSTVGSYGDGGEANWVRPGDSDKLQYLQSDAAGRSVLSLAVPNRKLPQAVIARYDHEGSELWRKDVFGDEVRALISPDGYTAVGYLTYLEHKGKQVPERHVALYDEGGSLIWDKGGMFFKPRLISVISKDSVLVADEKFLYVLDYSGKIGSKEELPGTLRGWWTESRNQRVILWLGSDLFCYDLK